MITWTSMYDMAMASCGCPYKVILLNGQHVPVALIRITPKWYTELMNIQTEDAVDEVKNILTGVR